MGKAHASPASKQKTRKGNPLGKLTAFGMTEPWQVALLLPQGWDDLTGPLTVFDPQQVCAGQPAMFAGRLLGDPQIQFEGKAPRLSGRLMDGLGQQVRFSAFGDTREFERQLRASRDHLYLFGQVDLFGGQLWLKSPEVIPPGWVGFLRPNYPGKRGVIGPDLVRERVLEHLESAIPAAVRFLAESLADYGTAERLAELAGLPGWGMEDILYQAHLPQDESYGQVAQRALEALAAMGIIRSAQGNQGRSGSAKMLRLDRWRDRVRAIPFALTGEQLAAIEDGVRDMAGTTPMRRLLSGDVGTGKSAVINTLAAAVVDAGGRVVLLLPNTTLATQAARDITSWWPDLNVGLVTGESTDRNPQAPLLVGTTALLHRSVGQPNLVVTDEQQKMSRGQREQLVGVGSHLLEATATAIPRSQALVRYGVVRVSRLTKNHTPKTIRTRIWMREQWTALYEEVCRTLAQGDRILLVYPLREKQEAAAEGEATQRRGPALRSAEEVFAKWSRLFPGRVTWAHGQMSDDEKVAAIEALKTGQAQVLVATTLVETGVNIPRLRRVVVVHPERHGLTTLHQLRGRLAREGGEGDFDLFLPYPIGEDSMDRLQVLVETQDGFEIAEKDMQLRGVGDLGQGSERQTGADGSFLFGRPVPLEVLDNAMSRLC